MIKAAPGAVAAASASDDEAEIRRRDRRAMHEAAAAFGNPAIYIEKALTSVRHIEVQVIADQVWQRRPHRGARVLHPAPHQKLIEEWPQPGREPGPPA